MADSFTKVETYELHDGDVEKVQAITTELLEKMGLTCTLSSSVLSEDTAILVDINPGDAAGLLIGKKGETLLALQLVVGLIFKTQNDRRVRILLNVNDWREKQNERLIELADQTAHRALEEGRDQNLYNLTPGQRRIIHTHLSQNTSVITESVGEGRERYLVVKPK